MKYIHEYSANKGFFDVLIQKYNVYGIPIIPVNPNLNFLSTMNYQLSNGEDYVSYLFILRLIELKIFFYIYFIFQKTLKKFFWYICFYIIYFSI